MTRSEAVVVAAQREARGTKAVIGYRWAKGHASPPSEGYYVYDATVDMIYPEKKSREEMQDIRDEYSLATHLGEFRD